MSTADLVAILVVALTGLITFRVGLVGMALALAGWVGAVILTSYGFPVARPHVAELVGEGLAAGAVTIAALFIASLIALSYVRHAIAGRIHRSAIGPLDRSLGLAAGIMLGTAILSGAYIAGQYLGVSYDRAFYREARAMPLIRQGARILVSLAPPGLTVEDVQIPQTDPQERFRTLLEPKTPSTKPKDTPGYDNEQRRAMDRLFDAHNR